MSDARCYACGCEVRNHRLTRSGPNQECFTKGCGCLLLRDEALEPPRNGWVRGGAEPELPYSNSSTSRDAAESMQSEASKTRAQVFEHIRSRGGYGATDDEIEVALGMSHQSASARRRELVIKERVAWSGFKRATRSGRKAQVWVDATREG